MKMTLGEMKEAIESFVEMYGEEVLDREVFATCDYGDHCHTQQLIRLDYPELAIPRETAYSQTGLALQDPDDERETGLSEVVVFGSY